MLVIGIWVVALLCPCAALAQEDESIEDEFALLEEELAADEVGTASKHRQSIFWSPSAITVLTREDIRASGAVNVPDLLRRVPGFDVYEMKPSFPLVGARALTGHANNLILVLVDGREPAIELSGWPIWAGLTVDLEEIERIEVIRGPGSTLYGANAFAGVVSITTLPDRPSTGADVSLAAGEGGTHRLFGRARGSFPVGGGTLDFSAGVGTLNRFSPSDRNDKIMYTDVHGHGYLRYRIGQRLDVSLHAGVAYGGGTMYFVFGDFRSSYVLNHFEMAKAELALAEGLKLKAQFYHIRFEGDLLYRASIESLGFWLAHIPSLHMDQSTLDGQVQLDYQVIEDLLLTAGGNIRYTMNETVNTTPSEIFELRGAGFIHAQWMLSDLLQLTGGLRYDLNSKTEGAISPRVVAVLRPWLDHSFRLGYGLAFRKPSFLEYRIHLVIEEAAFPEVVEKFATSLGNDKLVNERVHSIEAGWRARFLDDRLNISADLFYNIYVDMITFESEIELELGRPDILDSIFEYQNQDERFHAVGGEAQVVWKPSDAWMLWGNLGLRHVFDEDGNRLVSEPSLRANLGLRWTGDWGLFTDLAVHYVSTYEMPLYYPDETFEDPEDVPLGDVWLLIGRLGYRFERYEAGLTLRAPIGGPFREYPGVPMNNTVRTPYESDFAGEKLVRLAWFYLRMSY
jgi:iron complex outermembrane receptor protein